MKFDGPPEGKSLEIVTVSQNSQEVMKFDVNSNKIGSMVL